MEARDFISCYRGLKLPKARVVENIGLDTLLEHDHIGNYSGKFKKKKLYMKWKDKSKTLILSIVVIAMINISKQGKVAINLFL